MMLLLEVLLFVRFPFLFYFSFKRWGSRPQKETKSLAGEWSTVHTEGVILRHRLAALGVFIQKLVHSSLRSLFFILWDVDILCTHRGVNITYRLVLEKKERCYTV